MILDVRYLVHVRHEMAFKMTTLRNTLVSKLASHNLRHIGEKSERSLGNNLRSECGPEVGYAAFAAHIKINLFICVRKCK